MTHGSHQTDHTLDAALDALVAEFEGTFPAATIEECLTESHKQLLPARVTGYLPLLAHRFARERLRAASRPGPGADGHVPLVLFVCGANSGRSQMAAALLAHRAADTVEVASAGTAPTERVQAEVEQVLAEVGIHPGTLYPKPLTTEVQTAADVIVTMGCAEHLDVDTEPRRYRDWNVPDPAGLEVEDVRRIRDDIARRVDELIADLVASPSR